MDDRHSLPGFTLIELLLYIGIAAGIIFVSSLFFITFLEARTKNQVIAEVEQNGGQALYEITQTIRRSSGVLAPPAGNSASSLSLQMSNPQKNPSVFDVAGGALRIKEGATVAVPLNSSHLTVSNVVFRNLTYAGTPGVVEVEFTLSAVNPSGRNEYAYSQTFIGSASLR